MSRESMTDDDLFEFLEEDATPPPQPGSGRDEWQVLIVDDDEDVHLTSVFALRGLTIHGRRLGFLHAHSVTEGIQLLRDHRDVAVVLLDVVMESDEAGLRMIDAIRNELNLQSTRIVLRTGQPGYAPEIETIARYDINDYKTKGELTRAKLYATLTTAIRSFDQFRRLETNRNGLKRIISASSKLLEARGLQAFAAELLNELALFVGVAPNGLVCRLDGEADPEAPTKLKVVASAGTYRDRADPCLDDSEHPGLAGLLRRSLSERTNLITPQCVCLLFQIGTDRDLAACLETARPIGELDRGMLEMFCNNAALCGRNVELVERLSDSAFNDQLVRLPNRRGFIAAIERMTKSAGETLALGVLDIDQFSATNDLFGHRYGDRILRAAARRLDTLADVQCVIARISGDTFGVIGPNEYVNPGRLSALFARPLQIDRSEEQAVSVCLGFSGVVDARKDGETLLKEALTALKRAKQVGHGQSLHFDGAMQSESREHALLLHELKQDFGRDRLFLAFQPQVDLASRRVIALEALLRWKTASGQSVAPGRFIPLAEQTGLIVDIGTWVLRQALQVAKMLQSSGRPDLRVAVNLSPAQLRQPLFVSIVESELVAADVQPAQLELEVTESVSVLGQSLVIDRLKRLADLGITIAIDDFGTGYSSLSYLDQLTANRLKIDRSFISGNASGSRDFSIAAMIIDLALRLDMRTVAEGIETAAQAETLLAMGCEEAQGYYFARPMPQHELFQWLTQQEHAR
jgi:diguanylate cyclase (GGDEF)-like protein